MISSNCPGLTTSNHPSAISSFPRARPDRSIGHFDLLRPIRFDPGAIATTRLEPAANPDASAGQTRQIKTRRRETALVSFPDRNRNVPNPPSAEIHVDCRPALPYRRYFALDQGKPASVRQGVLRGLGVEPLIIRFGPQAKFSL